MSEIDISGLSKVQVLQALYFDAMPMGMGFLHFVPGPLSDDDARECLARGTYFDYLKGRVMKVDLSGDSFDPWLYDRDNGRGAAERAIAHIRSKA